MLVLIYFGLTKNKLTAIDNCVAIDNTILLVEWYGGKRARKKRVGELAN